MVATTNLQELVDVVPNVIVSKSRIQHFEVCVVHILENEAGSLGVGISDNIQQLDNVGATAQVLQDFYLALDLQTKSSCVSVLHFKTCFKSEKQDKDTMYLLLLYRLQDFDDAFLIADSVHSLKDLAIFPAPNLPHNLIIVLVPAQPSLSSQWGVEVQWGKQMENTVLTPTVSKYSRSPSNLLAWSHSHLHTLVL